MDLSKGLATLEKLAQTPTRRTYAQNRDLVSGLLPGLKKARLNGYGFKGIAKNLRADGYLIAPTSLRRHYLELTETGLECTKLIVERTKQPVELSRLKDTGKDACLPAEDDEYGFVEKSEYELTNVADGKTMIVFFKGIQDGKYFFDRIHANGNITEKSISPAAMKYYTITRK